MDIPEKIVNKILSGELRQEHGLETGTGSVYNTERIKGASDLEAQYKDFKLRRLI